MRPIKNESNWFVIEIVTRSSYLSYESQPFKFKTCWLCHKPHLLTYMCDECWQGSSIKVKISAENALREAVSAGYRTIHQFSSISWDMGDKI